MINANWRDVQRLLPPSPCLSKKNLRRQSRVAECCNHPPIGYGKQKPERDKKSKKSVLFSLCGLYSAILMLQYECFLPVMRIADWWKEHMRVCSSRGWNDEENRRHVSSRARAFPANLHFLLSQPSPCTLRFLKNKRISPTFLEVVFCLFSGLLLDSLSWICERCS